MVTKLFLISSIFFTTQPTIQADYQPVKHPEPLPEESVDFRSPIFIKEPEEFNFERNIRYIKGPLYPQI